MKCGKGMSSRASFHYKHFTALIFFFFYCVHVLPGCEQLLSYPDPLHKILFIFSANLGSLSSVIDSNPIDLLPFTLHAFNSTDLCCNVFHFEAFIFFTYTFIEFLLCTRNFYIKPVDVTVHFVLY